MYLGRMVELTTAKQLYDKPLHPYTEALLSSVPIPDPEIAVTQGVLSGDIPNPADPPNGCAFHTRCSKCMEICKQERPLLQEIEDGHMVACHLYEKEIAN